MCQSKPTLLGGLIEVFDQDLVAVAGSWKYWTRRKLLKLWQWMVLTGTPLKSICWIKKPTYRLKERGWNVAADMFSQGAGPF